MVNILEGWVFLPELRMELLLDCLRGPDQSKHGISCLKAFPDATHCHASATDNAIPFGYCFKNDSPSDPTVNLHVTSYSQD